MDKILLDRFGVRTSALCFALVTVACTDYGGEGIGEEIGEETSQESAHEPTHETTEEKLKKLANTKKPPAPSAGDGNDGNSYKAPDPVPRMASTCTSDCTLTGPLGVFDEKLLGERFQGYADGDDFTYAGGTSGLPPRETFALRPPPTQEQVDACPVPPPLPASCAQISNGLPGTIPTQQQMQQCWDDAVTETSQFDPGEAGAACKAVLFANLSALMQQSFLAVFENYSDTNLALLLNQELFTFGGGNPGIQMVQHFMGNTGVAIVWDNESTLSQKIRDSGQLVGPGKAFDKSVEALRQWVDARGGCPDWTELELGVLGDEEVSPLTNYPPTAPWDFAGWALQGPLGGTQALLVRLTAWEVDEATNTVSGTLQMVVGDDFGVDDGDVYSPGLLAFWILQHQRGYRPFNNLVEVDYPFSFQYTPETIPADLPAGAGELGARLRMTDDSSVRAAYCGGEAELSSSSALSQPTYQVLGSTLAEVGSFVEGDELIFSITVQDTVENQIYTYKTGPGSRNPDGEPHARVEDLGGGQYLISFEDRYIPTASPAAIDYDDVLILVKGELELETGCKCPMGDQLDIYYNWTSADGRDLDTRTSVVAPTSSNEVGWARSSTAGNNYLFWHGDNTGWSGNERVTVNLDNLRSDFPSSEEFRIDLRAFWYGERVAGYTRVTVSGCLNNDAVYYQPQLTTDSVGGDHPGELVGDLVIRLDSSNNPTGFTIDTSSTNLGTSSEAPYCQESSP